MDELGLDEMAVLKDVKAHPELRPYFFKKINKAKWFDALRDLGFFDVSEIPRPVEVKDQYFNIPNWPVLEYLVAASEQLTEESNADLSQKIWSVLTEITKYAKQNDFGNNRVWWQFSKILRLMPLELIRHDYLETIQYWLSDKFGTELVGDQLLGWLDLLLDSSDPLAEEFSVSLLEFIYAIRHVEKKYFTDGRMEAELTFKSYRGGRKESDSIARKAGSELGKISVDFFESKMAELLKLEGNDSWSSMWRKAIEDHEQNLRRKNASELLLEAFRDSLDGYLTVSQPEEVNKTLLRLLDNEYQTIKRIAIYAASNHFADLDEHVIERILGSDYFRDFYRHEIWHFLNRHFKQLSAEQRALVFKIIQGLEGRTAEDEDIDADIIRKRTAYIQSLWLSAIKGEDVTASALYRACIKITGDEPDHPDFSSYMTSGPIVRESPISVEDLYAMLKIPSVLVEFLNSYEQKGPFDEPSIEGLAKTFGGLVLDKSKLVVDSLDDLLLLKPHYLHELYRAFSTLWDESAKIDWDDAWSKLLQFSGKLFGGDTFWNYPEKSEGGAFIGNPDWVVGDVARLIEVGCKNDEHAVSLKLIPMARSVLEQLLGRQEGEEFELDSDAVSLAINSPRGRCIEAYINLALYHCRNTSEEGRPVVAALYLGLFEAEMGKDELSANQFEFITIFANYFPNFLYLSKDWSLDKIPKIFDRENRLRWLCAVQGFSYINYVISEVYDHLKDHGDFLEILDSEELKDRVCDQYIDFVIIGYFRRFESVEDAESLISLLLRRNNYRELHQLIWFTWTLRNEENLQRVKEMVYELFPKILKLIDFQSEEGKKMASALCHWAIFIDDLDSARKSWLLQISPHAEVDYNSTYLLEALTKLSSKYPAESFVIWNSSLENSASDYPPEEIAKIFRNLVADGADGLRNAKEIADRYLKLGLGRPRELLKEVLAEAADV